MKKALTILSLSILAAPAFAKKESAKAFMERYFTVVDSKAPEKLAEVDAPDFELVMPGGTLKGVAGHQQLMKGFATAFPNFKHSVTRCIQEGETMSCEGGFAGDHTGPFMLMNGQSIPATNKHVEFTWIGFATVKNGKVSSIHVSFDTMQLMQQLGAVPPPAVAKK
jgi:predicted ester cyclase